MSFSSKQEIRQSAINIAAQLKDVTSENIIEVSEKIANFICGNVSELPEYYDPNTSLRDLTKIMIDKVQETPRFPQLPELPIVDKKETEDKQ